MVTTLLHEDYNFFYLYTLFQQIEFLQKVTLEHQKQTFSNKNTDI